MAPLRGWAPRGERLVAKVPHGHWKTMTFVAALRHDRIEAPLDARRSDQRRMLQNLCRDGAGAHACGRATSSIMDNLGSHKGKAVRRAIRAAGAKLFFLPKYSPDLNPIEQRLRQAEASACERPRRERSKPSIAAIGELLDAYTAEECANYFANAGYATNLKSSRSRQRKELNVVKRERWTEADLDELPAEEPDGFRPKGWPALRDQSGQFS